MALTLTRWLATLACTAAVATIPPTASAQTGSEQWPGLTTSNLQTVYLLDRSGTETTGKLLAMAPDALVLLVNVAERRFERNDVARIQKRDSVKNGTLIGAAVGVGMGLLAAGISDCPGGDPGGSCGGVRAVTFATSVGVYAAIGAGIDALIRGRSTIYGAPPYRARASAVGSSPRAAVHVGFSW